MISCTTSVGSPQPGARSTFIPGHSRPTASASEAGAKERAMTGGSIVAAARARQRGEGGPTAGAGVDSRAPASYTDRVLGKSVAALLFLLAAAAPAGAEHEVYYRYTVLGYLKDAAGKPRPDVQV